MKQITKFTFPLLTSIYLIFISSCGSPIDGGGYHTLKVNSDQTVSAWGRNDNGQLGDGTNTTRNTSALVQGLPSAVSVSAGEFYSMAIEPDPNAFWPYSGNVWVWGKNDFGQLGDGSTIDRNLPYKLPPFMQDTFEVPIAAAKAGYYSSYAYGFYTKNDSTSTVDFAMFSWGRNDFGQLGDGTTTDRHSPVEITLIQNGDTSSVLFLEAGEFHAVASDLSGNVWTWGRNDQGQLGSGNTTDRSRAEKIPLKLGDLINSNTGVGGAVAAGKSHSFAIDTAGNVWGWGLNDRGQLGDGTTTNRLNPIKVPGLQGISNIKTGEYHSIAIDTLGNIYTWGDNTYGQLGDGTFTSSSTPKLIMTLPDTSGVIAAGKFHSMIQKKDGSVCVAGRNDYGQVGDGSYTHRNSFACGQMTRITDILRNTFSFDIFPNPSRDKITLRGSSEQTSPFHIKVFSIQGNLIDNFTYQFYGIDIIKQIDLSKYPKGIYIMRIINENGKEQYEKFVIQ